MGSYSDQQSKSIYWYNTAMDLRASAAAVHHAIQCDSDFPTADYGFPNGFRMSVACPRSYRMLWGMAFEVLAKAVAVATGENVREIHRLDDLAEIASVRYSSEQQAVLKIVSDAIYWHGRYPVPLKEEHWQKLSSLTRSTLLDEVPLAEGSDAIVLCPNNKLSWECLDELWSPMMERLFAVADWIGP